MKLASLRGGADGELVVVSRDLERAERVPTLAPNLQVALEGWANISPRLQEVSDRLESDPAAGFRLDPAQLAAPLPRAYQWLDGSAYVNHVELVRRARGAELPTSFWHEPLMYQGGSAPLLGPTDDIAVASEEWGIDFEAELAVVTTAVKAGSAPDRAGDAIALLRTVSRSRCERYCSG